MTDSLKQGMDRIRRDHLKDLRAATQRYHDALKAYFEEAVLLPIADRITALSEDVGGAFDLDSLRSPATPPPPPESPWYPDDSGDWVEVPDNFVGQPFALAGDPRIEVLMLKERARRSAQKMTGSSWDWFNLPGHECKIVAYKVVEK